MSSFEETNVLFNMNAIMGKFEFMFLIDDIMEKIRSDKRFQSLAFLDTLEFAGEKRDQWIRKALADYEKIDGLKTIDAGPALKCLLVKEYRKILQKKRKAGDKNPVVTEEDMLERLNMLGQN